MASRLRILTSNLWAHRVDPSGLAGILRDVDPDVLAVQELQEKSADVIAGHFRFHALAPHHDTLGTGIAVRREGAFTRLDMEYRSGWSVVLDPDVWPELAHPLDVVNVHFANPIGWPWWRSVSRRKRQLEALRRHIDAAPEALAVVGDFNASPMWPVYRDLSEVLVDGPLAAGTDTTTWRFQGRGPRLLRIDHAFVRGVSVITSRTVEVPGADHLGLVVDLTVPP